MVYPSGISDKDISKIVAIIHSEARIVCGESSVLQKKSLADLKSIDFSEVLAELDERAPTLLRVLRAAAGCESNTDKGVTIVLVSACLFFSRNPKMSRLQCMIGLLLDYSHVTNEVR